MLRSAWRGFRIATWLGWQIESNWTDPFLFIIYSVIKPIASVMILVVMYLVVSRSATQQPIFGYLYLGNAFYIFVGGVITGVSWAVIDDREHYGSLKYIYEAPFPYIVYLFGRGMARLGVASMAVAITLAFGIVVLKLPINFAHVNLPLFAVTLVIGIMSLAFIGLIIGGLTLLLPRHAWNLGEALAGALYVCTGAIFPLTVLPAFLRPLSLVFPVTYWLELIRRSLLGANPDLPGIAGYTGILPTDLQLLGILTGMTILYGVVALVFFRWAEDRARERGLFDQETNF